MRQTLIKKNTEEREKKKKKRGEREAAPGAVRKYVSAALRRRRIDAPLRIAQWRALLTHAPSTLGASFGDAI